MVFKGHAKLFDLPLNLKDSSRENIKGFSKNPLSQMMLIHIRRKIMNWQQINKCETYVETISIKPSFEMSVRPQVKEKHNHLDGPEILKQVIL